MDNWENFVKDESLKNIKYIAKRNRIKYLKDNWIAILSLAISAIALVKSFFF